MKWQKHRNIETEEREKREKNRYEEEKMKYNGKPEKERILTRSSLRFIYHPPERLSIPGVANFFQSVCAQIGDNIRKNYFTCLWEEF